MRQMDPKEIFRGMNFDDPLNLKNERGNSPTKILPFRNFNELQRYLFLKPLEKHEECL